jgi:CheY-like chemotaxis protein
MPEEKPKRWYVWYSYGTYTEREGPYSWEEICYMVLSGKIEIRDKIWFELWPDWKEAGSIPELAPYFQQRQKIVVSEREKKRILVVDDDNTLREFLQMVFTEKGYEAITAADGAEGLRMAFSELPDVIILDVTMPKLSGWEVCKRLKKDDATKNIPIIFLTAKDQVPDKLLGLELGGDRYLTKPFDLEQLEKTVEELLQQKRK